MAISTINVNTLTKVVYTSTNETAVTYLSLCNHSASPVTLDVHLVISAGSPGTDNLIISQLVIPADDSYVIYGAGEKIILDNGDTIQIVADTINVITAVSSYVGV